VSENEKKRAANYGIQANNISAEVLAVGDHARASKTIHGTEQGELRALVVQLEEALKTIKLNPGDKSEIDQDVANLHAEASASSVKADRAGSIVQSLSNKLKAAGVVLSDVVALAEPLGKLAGILHLPLHLLGL
jgi:hypothetical protein